MGRITARLLAPIAIAAVAVGVYLIVHDNVASHSSTAAHSHTARHHRRRRSHHGAGSGKSGKSMFYTVQSGDTLSDIASRTGVSLTRLEQLNPSLTPPYSLQTGQRLRLRR